MTWDEAARNALIAGGIALVLGVAAQFRRLHAALPFLFLAACALLTHFKMLDRSWALESLRFDGDWWIGAQLIGWMAISGLGLIRLTGWPATIAVAAVLGDRFAALGLVGGEPDPARRARLVLAASGASLIGLTGSPATLVLGWGGWRTVGLGVLLALVGWVGAPVAVMVREGGKPSTAVLAGIAGVSGVLGAWVLMVGGTAEMLAQGVEQAPFYLPRAWRLACAAGGVLVGAVVDEGLGAMAMKAVFDRGLDLMTDVPLDVVRAGLAVGGGLPLLVLTKSRLRVGIPLWIGQVIILLAWAQWFVR